MSSEPKLSAIIITQDEEKDIQGCLESLKSVVDEIVVVDSGSQDQTLSICRKFTDKVFSHKWPGYSAQKQFALEKATGTWVVNVDADERLTPSLQKEIKEKILNGHQASEAGFKIPFRHHFLGQRLRFGSARGETHIRLFKREQAAYGKEKIHEGIQVNGTIGKMDNPIDHHSYETIQDYLQKCNQYTSLIAEKKFSQGKRYSFWHTLRLPFEFIVRYIFKLGFLDGKAGLNYALLSSYYVWLKYLKLQDFKEEK